MSTISVKEFKMWLEGVEDMQAEGWIPDAKQWAKIREKINQLDDTARQQNAYTEDNRTRVATPVYSNAPAPMDIPASFNIPTFADPMASVPVQAAPSGLATVPVPGVGGGIKTTTPNIDTSGGHYTSLYA